MKKFNLLLLLCICFIGNAIATVHIINVSNFVFTPNALTVNCNDTIQFHRVNGTHPVISETGTWATFTMSGALINQNIVIATAGTYPYYCDFHGGAGGIGMAGTITVTCAPPTCNTPTGVSSSLITSTSAKISWSPVVGATKYQIQYRAVGAPTWLKKNATTTSKTLTGLTPSTTYQYKVKTICAAGSSPFSITQTFSTTALVGDEDNNKENISSHEEHVTQLGVYPNPNNGEFQVVMMHVHQDDVKIQIYDMTGRLLLEQPATIMDMDFVENIKIPAGFKGNAIVKVTVNGKDYTKDIVVQ